MVVVEDDAGRAVRRGELVVGDRPAADHLVGDQAGPEVAVDRQREAGRERVADHRAQHRGGSCRRTAPGRRCPARPRRGGTAPGRWPAAAARCAAPSRGPGARPTAGRRRAPGRSRAPRRESRARGARSPRAARPARGWGRGGPGRAARARRRRGGRWAGPTRGAGRRRPPGRGRGAPRPATRRSGCRPSARRPGPAGAGFLIAQRSLGRISVTWSRASRTSTGRGTRSRGGAPCRAVPMSWSTTRIPRVAHSAASSRGATTRCQRSR